MAQIVTLLTDFGTRDSYVAEVKAVLLAQLPTVTLVDISHEIGAYQIEEGAFLLRRAYSWFPPSTYHLAVVDPGVGSSRRCLFVKTGHGNFVGPDNGLLKWAVEEAEQRKKKSAVIYEIPIPEGTAPTFHGRDVFAPFLASHLRGRKSRLRRLNGMEGRNFPVPRQQSGKLFGEILAVDHYGNLITNVPLNFRITTAQVGKRRLNAALNYESIPKGDAALIAGSHGFWEISSHNASASQTLALKKGDPILTFS